MSAAFQVAVAKSYDPNDVSTDTLSEQKSQRARLSFIQRMQADSHNKRVNGQLSVMRAADIHLKQRVDDIALEKVGMRRQRPEDTKKNVNEPVMVTHNPRGQKRDSWDRFHFTSKERA